MPELGLVSLLRTLGLAVGCSLVAILLCFALHKTRKLFVTKISNAYLRVLAGSALLILLTLLFPQEITTEPVCSSLSVPWKIRRARRRFC